MKRILVSCQATTDASRGLSLPTRSFGHLTALFLQPRLTSRQNCFVTLRHFLFNIILAVLLILSASATFSVGGETVLSAHDQKKYEDLNKQLEDIDPAGGTYAKERLKIYKELLELKPEDPIYFYYVKDLAEKITAKKSPVDKKPKEDIKEGMDKSYVSDQKQKKNHKTEILADAPGLKSEKAFQRDGKTFCVKKWTKRGRFSKSMYNRCVKTQRAGYKDLKQLHNRYAHEKTYSDILYPYCSTKWTRRGVADVHMMAYCLKKEVEGFNEVINYQKQYNKSEVIKIAEGALIRYGSWKIAAYKIKQHFK